MTFISRCRAGGALLLAAALLGPAQAHEGHDHGDATPVAALPALAPRAEASGDLFELLAVADGAQLQLWLDRYASNAPVPDARIEVEGPGWRAEATAQADGSYRVALPRVPVPGALPLVFTVQAGADADLLETTLVVPPPTPVSDATAIGAGLGTRAAAAAALLATALAAAVLWRRRRAQPTVGGLAR